jgi:hypothetical protein
MIARRLDRLTCLVIGHEWFYQDGGRLRHCCICHKHERITEP